MDDVADLASYSEEPKIELTPEGAAFATSSEEPISAAPEELREPGSPARQSEPSPINDPANSGEIDPRVEQLIRETEQRLSGKLGSLVDRVNRTTKDETRAKFEELQARNAEQYELLSQQLDQLVASGKLSEADAAVQKLSVRDELDSQARWQAAQAAAAQPDPSYFEFERRKRDVLESLDLTGQEPEYAAVMGKWDSGRARDIESAAEQYRTLAKQVRKAVDARVSGRRDDAPSQPIPVIDTGGGRGAKPSRAEQELASMLQQGPPDDPGKTQAYLHRLKELRASLK